jgi:hypothetical protein
MADFGVSYAGIWVTGDEGGVTGLVTKPTMGKYG